MRFHDHGSYPRNVCAAVAILFLGCSFLLTASAQDPPKPSAPSEQAASSTPLPVIKTESRIVLVDAVVTDKKGNYIHDLTQQNFRVYEDNKEQKLVSLSFGSEAFTEPHRGQKHYIVLFFDNSSMELLDQMQARKAAAKFIEQNAGDDRLMAVAEFGGSLHIRQDFTATGRAAEDSSDLFANSPHGNQCERPIYFGRSSRACSFRQRFRCALPVSLHSQRCQESSLHPRPQNADSFFRGLPHSGGPDAHRRGPAPRTHSHNRRLQQVECDHLFG